MPLLSTCEEKASYVPLFPSVALTFKCKVPGGPQSAFTNKRRPDGPLTSAQLEVKKGSLPACMLLLGMESRQRAGAPEQDLVSENYTGTSSAYFCGAQLLGRGDSVYHVKRVGGRRVPACTPNSSPGGGVE